MAVNLNQVYEQGMKDGVELIISGYIIKARFSGL